MGAAAYYTPFQLFLGNHAIGLMAGLSVALKVKYQLLYGLLDIHILAIRAYTSTDDSINHSPLNTYLRKKASGAKFANTDMDAYHAVLGEALDRLPVHSGQVVLRRAQLPSPIVSAMTPGSGIPFAGYLSTTLDPKILVSFPGQHYLTIDSLRGRDVSELSCLPYEQEVLFHHLSLFVVRTQSTGPKGELLFDLEEV